MNTSCRYALILLLFTCLSCNRSRLQVDVSNISLSLQIDRFEKDIFEIDSLHMNKSMESLARKYPDFLRLFMENIIQTGNSRDSDFQMQLVHFVSNKDLKTLKKDIDSVYPNLSVQKAALEDAFKHYLYYYPKGKVPRVISFISGFNNAIVNTDLDLGIGLDMFMGKSYRFYTSVQFPRYMIRTLTPEHLPVTAMKGFVKQNFPQLHSQTNLLGNMIYEGKILYLLDALIPNGADSLKIGYSAAQIAWCKENESKIWGFAVENNNLFSSEKSVYERFFAEGPFTQGLTQESAPRLGMWTGWQIIRHYMDKNPSVSIPHLMAEQDDQKILQDSEYKP